MFTSALINAENIQNMKLILSKYTNIPIAGTVVLLLRNIKQNHSDNFSVAHSWVNYTKYLQGPQMLEMRNEDNNTKNAKITTSEPKLTKSAETFIFGGIVGMVILFL